MENTKQWYTSKTLWFNVVTIILGIVEVITKTYPIDPTILGMIMGIGNLVLRMISGDPITFGSRTLYKGK